MTKEKWSSRLTDFDINLVKLPLELRELVELPHHFVGLEFRHCPDCGMDRRVRAAVQ